MSSDITAPSDSRFKHLLAPCKDLAKNFNLDIVQDLVKYQNDLRSLEEELPLESQLEDDSLFNFAEAGLLIQGSASVYGRKVDYVHHAAFAFGENLKATKRKVLEPSDDQSGPDEQDGIGVEKRKKRVRAHDNDPLAFPRIKFTNRPYMDTKEMKKKICKRYLDVNLNASLLKDPPSVVSLPDDLKPIPDSEKEHLCVTGLWMRSFEAIGKVEDYWTLSYCSSMNERQWSSNTSRLPMPIHSARVGGCRGCADEKCPDSTHFPYSLALCPATGKKKLVKNNIYLESSDFLLIRKKYLKHFQWVRVGDLMARSDYWNEVYEEIRRQRVDISNLLNFATTNIMSDQPFSQGTLGTVRHCASDSLGMERQSIGTSQSHSIMQGSHRPSSFPSLMDSEHIQVNGHVYHGRASSRLEFARRLSSLPSKLTSLRPSTELWEEEESEGEEEGVDSESNQPLTGIVNQMTQVEEVEEDPWSESACIMSSVVRTGRRDPFGIDEGLLEIPARRLTRKQRCQDSVRMREKQKNILSTMSLGRRLSHLHDHLNGLDGTNGRLKEEGNEEDEWLNKCNMFTLSLLKTVQKQKTQRSTRECVRSGEESGNKEEVDENMNGESVLCNPFSVLDGVNEDISDQWEEGEEDNDYDENLEIEGEEHKEKELKFSDLKEEDMTCDLIDIRMNDHHSFDNPFMNQYSNAYEAVLQNPQHSVTQRMNVFMQKAQDYEDRRSEMQREVQDWEDQIVGKLEEEESHKPFDVHEYGGEVINSFDQQIGEEKTIEELLQGKQSYEASRVFLSVLMMANTNNVEISHDPSNPINSMRIRLLDKNRPHERLDEEGVL